MIHVLLKGRLSGGELLVLGSVIFIGGFDPMIVEDTISYKEVFEASSVSRPGWVHVGMADSHPGDMPLQIGDDTKVNLKILRFQVVRRDIIRDASYRLSSIFCN